MKDIYVFKNMMNSIETLSHARVEKWYDNNAILLNYLSIPKLQRWNRRSLGVYK